MIVKGKEKWFVGVGRQLVLLFPSVTTSSIQVSYFTQAVWVGLFRPPGEWEALKVMGSFRIAPEALLWQSTHASLDQMSKDNASERSLYDTRRITYRKIVIR